MTLPQEKEKRQCQRRANDDTRQRKPQLRIPILRPSAIINTTTVMPETSASAQAKAEM